MLGILLWTWSFVAAANWITTVNTAGFQRTLSQKMTKEFLLVARGIETSSNKLKMSETIHNFDTTLEDLQKGNGDIICSNASEVQESIQNVLDLWGPYKKILLENVDSVRDAASWVRHQILEDLSVRTRPLLDACDEVVSRLVVQAKAAFEWKHSIVQDVAFRQRTLVQALAKVLLFLSEGTSMVSNMEELAETKSIFEESHEGIIRGVPFAGIPVLKKLCTMHQLSEVTLHYQQLRPLLNQVMNSQTNSEAQRVATQVVEEAVGVTEPLFDAVMDAVNLVVNDSGLCQPAVEMSSSSWRHFLDALGQQRLLTQKILQEVTQVVTKVDVKSAQVEIIVHEAEASENLRSLIEGNGMLGIPPPPTQEMLNQLLETWEVWEQMETELQSVVHHDTVSDAMVFRVLRLGKETLIHLETILEDSLQMVRNSTDVPGDLMNVVSQQAVLVSQVWEEACLINMGLEVDARWQSLNASRELVMSRHFDILQGNQMPPIARTTNVCLVQQMKLAMDLFRELDQEALAVARGASSASLAELGPSCVNAFAEVASSNVSCEDQSLSADQWKQLHHEIGQLSILSEAIPAEMIQLQQGNSLTSEHLEFLLQKLEMSLRRVMFGSWQPAVAAPPNQEYFNDMLDNLEPAAVALREAAETTAMSAGRSLLLTSTKLRQSFLQEVQLLDPGWPGQRVDVALHQLVLAHEIFKEFLLRIFDIHTGDELEKVIQRFQTAHLQLKDGGNGIPPILIPERNDLLDEWHHVDEAWNDFKGFQDNLSPTELWKLEKSLLNLETQLEKILPLFALEDVEAPEGFPWAICIYSILGVFLGTCCCLLLCIPWSRSRKAKDEKGSHSSSPIHKELDEV